MEFSVFQFLNIFYSPQILILNIFKCCQFWWLCHYRNFIQSSCSKCGNYWDIEKILKIGAACYFRICNIIKLCLHKGSIFGLWIPDITETKIRAAHFLPFFVLILCRGGNGFCSVSSAWEDKGEIPQKFWVHKWAAWLQGAAGVAWQCADCLPWVTLVPLEGPWKTFSLFYWTWESSLKLTFFATGEHAMKNWLC